MKLSIECGALSTAIDAAIKAATRNEVAIPIIQHFRLRTDGNRLTVTGCDLNCYVQAAAPAEVEVQGDICVPAATVQRIIKGFNKQATIKITGDARRAQVTARSSKYDLPTLPPSDFPTLEQPTNGASFRLSGEDIRAAFGRISPAISTDQTRFYLLGVHIHLVDGKLRAEATDGVLLMRHVINGPDGSAKMPEPGVIVPERTCEEIVRLFGEHGAQFTVSKSLIRVVGPNASLLSKLIDGTFPDCDRVIPPSHSGLQFTADRKAALECLDRIINLCRAGKSRIARIAIAADELTISARDPEIGEGQESTEAEADIPDDFTEYGFNSERLRDALTAASGDRVTVSCAERGSPLLITGSADSSSFLSVLMPIR